MAEVAEEIEEPKSENRTVSVMVRLTETEAAEIRKQGTDLALDERRSVGMAEVLRRRAWGELPVVSAA